MSTSPSIAKCLARARDVLDDEGSFLSIWRRDGRDDVRNPTRHDGCCESPDAGAPLLELLSASGVQVGACFASHRRMMRDGRPLCAAAVCDLAQPLANRPIAMSLGLTQSLERAACGHLQLLYAFPRMMEVPLFKRVGFRPIGDVVRYVRVLQHAPFLGKRIPWILARLSGPALDAWARTRDALCNAGTRRLLGTWTDRVDPRMQRLWETSTKPDGIVGTRDAAYLSSRFDASTDDGFRFLLVTDPTTNDLLAWFAVRPMGRTLHVLDYWSSHGPAIGTRVLYMLLHCSSKTGYVAVSLDQSSLSPYLSPWRATGFVECSRRPVMGYWHTHALGQHLGEVHLTAGDSAY